MNIKALIPTCAFALASIAGVANAQTIPALPDLNSENDGDLVLGFENTTTAPTAGDLVVDLGSADNFYTTGNTTGSVSGGPLTAGTTYTVAAFNSADLAATYGGTGFSTNTLWTVFGGNGAAAGPGNESVDTLWGSSGNGQTLLAKAKTLQSGTSGNLDQFTNSLSGAGNATTSGAYASNDATNVPTGAGGLAPLAQTGNNFGYFSSSVFDSTAGTTKLELYELLPTTSGTKAGIDLGTFTLNSTTGLLTFTAIPEPSFYAAVLGALTIGFVMIRRRSQTAGMSAIA